MLKRDGPDDRHSDIGGIIVVSFNNFFQNICCNISLSIVLYMGCLIWKYQFWHVVSIFDTNREFVWISISGYYLKEQNWSHGHFMKQCRKNGNTRIKMKKTQWHGCNTFFLACQPMAYNTGILLLHEQLTRFLPLGTRKNLIYFTPSLNLSAHVKINIYAIFFFKQNVSNRY